MDDNLPVEGESSPADNDLVPQDEETQGLTKLHKRQQKRLWALVNKLTRELRDSADTLSTKSQTLQRLARVQVELVKVDRMLSGQDGGVGQVNAGVIIIQGKDSVEGWKRKAPREVKRVQATTAQEPEGG